MGVDEIIEEQAQISPGVTPPSVRQRQQRVAEQRERELEAERARADGGEAMPTIAIGGWSLDSSDVVSYIEENPEVAQAYLLGVNTVLLILLLWKV